MSLPDLAERYGRPTAITVVVVGMLAAVAALAIALAYGLDLHEAVGGAFWVGALAFMIPGLLITTSRPTHAVGWILVWIGFTYAVSVLLVSFELIPGDVVPLADAWTFTIADVIAVTGLVPVPLALLLFPDGRPLSPRWRVLTWLVAPTALVGALATLFVGGWGGDPTAARQPGPLGDAWFDAGRTLSRVFFPALAGLLLAGAVSLILRYRRSAGESRKQLQWLAAAGAAMVAVTGTYGLIAGDVIIEAAAPGLEVTLVAGTLALVPVAATVAILKYRLYDIDVVINRALVVATLGAFITAVYVGIVAGIGAFVGTRGERDLVLSVLATAIVAVAFQPVRRRVQRVANRLVYGERATPYEVLSRFSRRSTEGSGDILDDVAALLAEGTGAERAVVHAKVGDTLRPEAVWPPEQRPQVPVTPVGNTSTGEDEVAVRVEHEGELLGMVSLRKPAGQPVLPTDRELVQRIAGGLGILLRNRRLTTDLQHRIDELQRSRRRLVKTQDDTRRKLERDMHDGPQQQLVGLKVQVGLLQRRAESLGATETAGLLRQLADDADAAIDAVRDVARGIYPPLLAEEGIAGAVTAQARKLPVPVTVQAPGLGRHAPDLEAAVYFCILEALTNAVKYADAGSVVVALAERDGALHVSVTDDGAGFDPQRATGSGLANMADRVDALGGTATVRSEPGRGTTVELRVPVAPIVPEPA